MTVRPLHPTRLAPARGGDGPRRLGSEAPLQRPYPRVRQTTPPPEDSPVVWARHSGGVNVPPYYGFAEDWPAGAGSDMADQLAAWRGQLVQFTFELPAAPPNGDTLSMVFSARLAATPVVVDTFPGPHPAAGTYVSDPFTWPADWAPSGFDWAAMWICFPTTGSAVDWQSVYDYETGVTKPYGHLTLAP